MGTNEENLRADMRANAENAVKMQAAIELIADLEQLDVGDVYDMLTEQGNDSCDYQQVATQDDIDKF
jgi:FKBP-type peptidyl-prolyl cis-trans isomerase (trigger factor)